MHFSYKDTGLSSHIIGQYMIVHGREHAGGRAGLNDKKRTGNVCLNSNEVAKDQIVF